jgi:hypothetical protein
MAYQKQPDKIDASGIGSALGSNTNTLATFGVNDDRNEHNFRWLVNQAELNLSKAFGENISARVDLDFQDLANTDGFSNTGARDAVAIEQAYVTANLAAGNGIEFMVGKFNSPIGLDVVDARENIFVTYSNNFLRLQPFNVTGVKFYYEFSDMVDLHLAVVNDLNANGFGTGDTDENGVIGAGEVSDEGDSAVPSAIMRVGFNWGDDDNPSGVGIGGAIGPERAGDNDQLDFLGNLDFMVALTDTVNLGGEFTYRQSNTAGEDNKAMAAQLLVNWQASDVWDLSLRGGWMSDMTELGVTTSAGGLGFLDYGVDTTNFNGSLGVGYAIAEDAKLKVEYRFDLYSVDGLADPSYHAGLFQFAYSF